MFIDGISPPKRPATPASDKDESTPTADPSFSPPEEIADFDQELTDIHAPDPDNNPSFGGPRKTRRKLFGKIPLTKKNIIILSVVLALLLGGGAFAAYKVFFKKAAPAPVIETKVEEPVVEAPVVPTTLASPLTGVQVEPALAKLPVTGIMIENSPDARPQSGLNQAGVVYEAIAEGGITRFLALFQESKPDYVGPVRSVRPYYLEWLQGYDAGIAHVGGSPEALALIKSAGVKDLDQFYNSGAYHRVSSRYAPHNMYTSLNDLLSLETSKGLTSSNFTGFTRKADTASTTPTASSIDFTISGYLYNVHYDYDAASNSYKRSEGGKAHMDEKSGAQLQPKVVVGLIIPYNKAADGVHSVYATTGSGKAYVFQDGVLTTGTWSKTSSKDPLVLKDDTGAALALNAGQTWISVMATAGSVAYK